MTPDEAPGKARALLDGTTPGPWEVDHDHAWEPGVWSPDCIVFGPYYDRWDMEQWEAGNAADLRLAAAAPALAALAAGMRAEYRTEYQAHGGRWFPVPRYCGCDSGWGTKQRAEIDADDWKDDGYATRILRRYVTKQEEIA